MNWKMIIPSLMLLASTAVLTGCGSSISASNSPTVPTGTYPYGYPGYTLPAGYSYTNGHLYAGQINITDQGTYQSMLKDQKICGYLMFGNVWNYDCSNWSTNSYVYLSVNSSAVPTSSLVTILA